MSSQQQDFFMSNPVKNCFLIETFSYLNTILRKDITFYAETTLENPLITIAEKPQFWYVYTAYHSRLKMQKKCYRKWEKHK